MFCVLQVDQITSPQPVEVCVCCLRATRDKLPRGLYTVSVALHSRLGGPALAWHSKKEQHERAVSTEPTEHRGRYCDTDLNINQSLFMVRTKAEHQTQKEERNILKKQTLNKTSEISRFFCGFRQTA